VAVDMEYMNNALENWNELRDIYEDNHNLLLNMGALAHWIWHCADTVEEALLRKEFALRALRLEDYQREFIENVSAEIISTLSPLKTFSNHKTAPIIHKHHIEYCNKHPLIEKGGAENG
jgi:hypothetical protein